VQGEAQKKLDVISNEILLEANAWGGHLAACASEEMDHSQPVPDIYPRGDFLLLFDPLDGSSNIDVNVSVGTIFSVLRCPTNVELPNADLARYEGMLVRFVTPLTVNQNKYLGERGELTLSHGRRENPTNRHPAGSPEAAALARENAANEIVLDDGIFSTPAVIPYLFEDGT
ncbi:hypothetical protein QCF01_19170, partial [Staphylococcus aureus]|nr:hypothetical protein [Staphylococcus aureus]